VVLVSGVLLEAVGPAPVALQLSATLVTLFTWKEFPAAAPEFALVPPAFAPAAPV